VVDDELEDEPDPVIETAGRAAAVASALQAIGWRSASDVPAGVVAAELDHVFAAARAANWGAPRLRAAVAECLRMHAHALDGSSSSVTAWYPTASEIMRKVGGV